MLITFINIDRGYRMHQQNIYTTEIHKRVIRKNWGNKIVYLFVIIIYKQPNLHS